MARAKIHVPEKFVFSTIIPVRITDLNYGGHVGNDAVLSIIHEVRVQFIQHLGYTEMNFAGVGLIMSDVCIEYKQELFYGDQIQAKVALGEISRIGFEIVYCLKKKSDNGEHTVSIAKTGMVCYDYATKRLAPLPGEAKNKLLQ